MPAHLRSLKRRRAERVRSDLPTIAVMLATKVANTKSLLVALREITEIGTGPVVDDIKRACSSLKVVTPLGPLSS